MTQNTQKPRDLSLDVAKGMCIILMVVAHSGCPEWMGRFIYMFHMPCFFFISGMLLSDRYLDTPGVGVRKKLKGYYKPFVKWQLVFLLLHNLFVALHVIAIDYMFNERNIHRIQAHVLVSNQASLKMHQKCGYQIEGTLAEAVFKNGRYQDQYVLALINKNSNMQQSSSR